MSDLKVNGYSHLYRDSETGYVVNKDDDGYNSYVNFRERRKEKAKKQEDEINEIKNEISEIKSLLKELLNGSQ